MSKILKRFTSGIVVALMVALTAIAPGISASAATSVKYVAFGDSIAVGMSAYTSDGWYGYTNMYYDYLNHNLPLTTKGQFLGNFSKTGAYSFDLLQQFIDSGKAGKSAKVITINIGGENLLAPFINAAFSLYGIKIVGDIDDEYAQLYNAISYDSDALQKYFQMAPQLDGPLNYGTNVFISGKPGYPGTGWSEIIKQIRSANRNAVIYVNKLYNPLMTTDPLTDPLYQVIDMYVNQINSEIVNQSQNNTLYKVVDVYSALKVPGAVMFNPQAAISITKQYPVCTTDSLRLFILNLDPHPTAIGHALIFAELKNTN